MKMFHTHEREGGGIGCSEEQIYSFNDKIKG